MLVVDDDAALVGVLAETLEMEGYRAVAARGVPAVRLARDAQPDVVLLDLVQPGIAARTWASAYGTTLPRRTSPSSPCRGTSVYAAPWCRYPWTTGCPSRSR